MMRIIATLALVLGLASAAAAQPADPANTVYLDTKDGRITIRLRPDLAPKHAEQIKTLVKRGFYDGIVFHRVI
ncbi:MAG: peptidylprolyl isomerase, partial [Methylobacteriaceae bacterium]|nr:peptidylprolyl isomerase [Methylobacteriaceae bacterium]